MKKINKLKIFLILIFVVFVLQALYFTFVYENKRFNAAVNLPPEQLKGYEY